MNELLSAQWVQSANEALQGHPTGTVPEFELTVSLSVSGEARPRGTLVIHGGEVRFADPMEKTDASIVADTLPNLRLAVLTGADSAEQVTRLLASGTIAVGGDLNKLGALRDGMLRGAPAELVRTIEQSTGR